MLHIDVGLIISIISTLVMLGGLCIGAGVLKGKIDHNDMKNDEQTKKIDDCATKGDLAALIKRMDEDRAVNATQHKEFYGYQNRIVDIEATMKSLKASVDELKEDVKQGFKEIQQDIKSLSRRA
jgi:outer membrane murein-binding lipoprotein Lpp